MILCYPSNHLNSHPQLIMVGLSSSPRHLWKLPPYPVSIYSIARCMLTNYQLAFQDCSRAVRIGSVTTFIETGIAWIISTRTADAIFDRYCVELAETFPAVVINPQTSGPQVRTSQRVLFLAILAAGCDSICDVDTQKRLRHLLMKVLAHCILNNAEYTVELVQAFIVSALWHKPSEPILQGEDFMDMPQLSHTAANIAIHIGLDKQTLNRNNLNTPARRRGQDSRCLKPSQITDIEARRTWLGCYYICAK